MWQEAWGWKNLGELILHWENKYSNFELITRPNGLIDKNPYSNAHQLITWLLSLHHSGLDLVHNWHC